MASITNVNQSTRTLANTSNSNFRTLIAKTAIDHMLNDNSLFFFVSKETTPSGASADSLYTQEFIYENIITLEKIGDEDVSLVTPRINWTSGVVYDPFDGTKNYFKYDVSFDGGVTMRYKPYVMTDDYNVYVCIKNCESGLYRDRKASVVKPTSVGTEVFETSDGYTWKYLYSVNDEYFKFLTTLWMPVPKTIQSIPSTLSTTSAKYRQYQVQEKAKTTAGRINDVRVDLGQKNVYFNKANPTASVVGFGTNANVQITTSYVADKGYKLTGYRIVNGGTGYAGGKLSFNDSPNGNGDITSRSALENLITLETSYGGVEKDLGSDPSTTLQATTLMFVNEVRETDDTIGSFPIGMTAGSFGIIANPVYATGDNAGRVAGSELSGSRNSKLTLRQAAKYTIRDDSGTGFSLVSAASINDSRLETSGTVSFSDAKTNATILELQPYNYTSPGSSVRSNILVTGAKTLAQPGDIISASKGGETFEVEEVYEPTIKVGSGDILYIIPTTFNILKEQIYTARFIVPL